MSETLIPRPFSDFYKARITRTVCSCGFVGLQDLNLRGYRHADGWPITWGDMTVKFWLYVTCPKCKYEWALWKLGVPRDLEFPPQEKELIL